MPRRADLHRILVIGSGPIVIGQAAEFDYSGTQAAKALREEGYEVDPRELESGDDHDRSGVRGPDVHRAGDAGVRRADHRARAARRAAADDGRPDGAQRRDGARERGVLEKYGVELIGATARAIAIAEDREQFAEAMDRIGLGVAEGRHRAHVRRGAWRCSSTIGFPAIIRPSFTLGGTGGGIAYNREEYEDIVRRGLDAVADAARCSSSAR